MPRILRSSSTWDHVALAVAAWSWLTALAPLVSRSEKAVRSNCDRSPSTPRPSSSTRSSGTPPVPGRLGRADWEHAVAPMLAPPPLGARARRDALAGSLREEQRRVAFVEVPDG